ncbi:MAG: BREX system serine/threonine kinase PglW [Leptothrix sp. (in: b-proteobacteria)]
MTLSPARWQVISESNFQWEREALDWLKANLPDRDPWAVWTNFEFIDDEGKVNEVDALVLSPAGLFLVEIKSRPGVLTGDTHTWTWRTDGRDRIYDNPLILANRKAKRLASLLRRQSAVVKAKIRLPFVEPAIFLSSTSLACRLEGLARTATFQHGRPGSLNDDGLVGALANGITQRGSMPVDTQQARAIAKGLREAGIRPSNKHRQVGDYQLDKLLTEGDGFQDWSAHHVSTATVHRRVRIHTIASATSAEARAARVRAALREFEILEGIDHPGLLKVKDYKDTELGPALVFDHDPRAIRLDHLLRDHGSRLSVTQRLQLIRDIAETLRFAHAKRLYHRALGPQSVLVLGVESGQLQPKLMNWQTGSRQAANAGEGGAGTVHHTTGTRHVEDYVDDPGLVYLAPETTRADPSSGAGLDVFSLGCIAYHVFSGQPPATSVIDLIEKLRIGQGLRLSDVMDGCGARLQDLIQYATCPDLLARYDSIQDFLAELDGVEDELTTPDPEVTVDPTSAVADDRLEGGFTVIRRMGKGSSSDALMVKEDGSDEPWVLKVAIDAAHNERLQNEGEILASLRHPNIVEYRRTLSVAGRTALLMRNAGEQNLAEQIRKDGRLSLDLLQRFGEELIEVVNLLEGEGVAHRDIKPENIGISKSRNGKLQLVLFDFSLSRTPPENITAGTTPYLDPFLPLRGARPRWDLFAERFATAVTLYEMAVGQPPVWGDGRTSPAMLDVEASVETDLFDPVIRAPLGTFFKKALQRDFRQRHDNAEEMLRDWRAIFATRQSQQTPEPQGFEAIALTATHRTTMVELGYSLEAQDVLERMGIHNARELLAVDRIRFRYLRGVGDKIRKEIRLTAKELARLRPDLTEGRTTLHDEADEIVGATTAVSINELAAQLLPRRPASEDRPDEDALALYLGLEDYVPAGRWMTLGDTATASQIERTALTAALVKARQRWLKLPTFTELREQIATLVRSHSQVMSAHEAAMALLALRGCASQDDSERLRLANAVLRAAAEAEAHLETPRFEAHDHQPSLLIATSAAWADYARQLGSAADICALADPLMPPQRVLEALESVPLPTQGTSQSAGQGTTSGASDSHSPLPATRLLRLATSASRKAALSSRQEIYPRGMPAVLAVRQSIGALVGAPLLRAQELRDRVKGRYPEAAALPARPELDRLLDEAGAPMVWDATALDGEGAYRSAMLGNAPTAGVTTHLSRDGTTVKEDSAGYNAVASAHSAADQIDPRLQRARIQGGLLVLTVEPRLARHAETELLRRHADAQQPLTRLSFDALLLRELKAQAQAARVDWSLVLNADAAEPTSRDWSNLMRLVQRSLPAVRQALLQSPAPLLLVNLGLLARYNLMTLVTELEEQAGRPDRTPAAWMLLPTHHQGAPLIDGVALPLVRNIHQTQALQLPAAWVKEARAIHAS